MSFQDRFMPTKEAMKGIARKIKSKTVEVVSVNVYIDGVEKFSAPIKAFKGYDSAVEYLDKVENADFPIDIIHAIPFEDGNLEPISSSIWEWEKVDEYRMAAGVYTASYTSHVTKTKVEIQYYTIGAEMED